MKRNEGTCDGSTKQMGTSDNFFTQPTPVFLSSLIDDFSKGLRRPLKQFYSLSLLFPLALQKKRNCFSLYYVIIILLSQAMRIYPLHDIFIYYKSHDEWWEWKIDEHLHSTITCVLSCVPCQVFAGALNEFEDSDPFDAPPPPPRTVAPSSSTATSASSSSSLSSQPAPASSVPSTPSLQSDVCLFDWLISSMHDHHLQLTNISY